MKQTTQNIIIALILIVTVIGCAFAINWAVHNKIPRAVPDNYSAKIYELENQVASAHAANSILSNEIAEINAKVDAPRFSAPAPVAEPTQSSYCVASESDSMINLTCKKK